MPRNSVPAAALGLPAITPPAPLAGLTVDHLHEIREEMAFALDISARRPDTPDELETRRYLRATVRDTKHLIKKREAGRKCGL